MGLRLEIVSKNRKDLGSIGVKDFGQDGGTIGRSLSNDWALPDRERFMSSRHASIDFRSGSYYLVDTSTNGVYINESETPVGRGNPQRIFTGDRIRMGAYVMVAIIDTDDSEIDPLAVDGHVDPVERAQRVETPEPTTYDLLDEKEITGVGIEMILEGTPDFPLPQKKPKDESGNVFEGLSLEPDELAEAGQAATEGEAPAAPQESSAPQEPPAPQSSAETAGADPSALELQLEESIRALQPDALPAQQSPASDGTAAPPQADVRPARVAAAAPQDAPQPAATARAAPQPAPRSAAQSAPRPAPASPAQQTEPAAKAPAGAAAPAGQDTTLTAFFKGAGLDAQALEPAIATTTAFLIGQLMRELLTGLSESLHVRAQQKAQMRLADTLNQPRDDNPLKFAPDAEQALNQLLFSGASGRFGPVESVRRAYADVRGHQQALLDALAIAVPEFLSQLAPQTVEEKFARAGQATQTNPNIKVKYWKHYQDLFNVLSRQVDGELPAQFLEKLAQAYESVTSGEKASEAQPSRAKTA